MIMWIRLLESCCRTCQSLLCMVMWARSIIAWDCMIERFPHSFFLSLLLLTSLALFWCVAVPSSKRWNATSKITDQCSIVNYTTKSTEHPRVAAETVVMKMAAANVVTSWRFGERTCCVLGLTQLYFVTDCGIFWKQGNKHEKRCRFPMQLCFLRECTVLECRLSPHSCSLCFWLRRSTQLLDVVRKKSGLYLSNDRSNAHTIFGSLRCLIVSELHRVHMAHKNIIFDTTKINAEGGWLKL